MRGWLVVAAVTLAAPVRAETPAEHAAKLFEQGRDLVAHSDYKRAYEVFSQSYELDRAVGTELNLADCLDHLNQPVKAIELYQDAAKQLDAIGKAPQAKFARERIDALGTRVATIIIELKPQLPETTVSIGGHDVAAAPTIRERVDPGSVEVVVAAPGAHGFSKTVTATAGGTETMTISLAAVESPATLGSRDPQRVWIGLGLGAAGGVSLVASLVTIIVAKNDYNNATQSCLFGVCPQKSLDEIRHAQHISDVSTGLFVGGLALAAAGGIVWYTAPREHVTVVPTATPTSAGVTLLGRF